MILARPARRALAEQLPTAVAVAASDLITGALAANPHRLGKALDKPMEGVYSARVMTQWRILYEIDDDARTIAIKNIRHRRDAYRHAGG